MYNHVNHLNVILCHSHNNSL